MFRSRKDINMTQGVIWKQIVAFAIPLLIGNLFQQLYNTVDSVVVGHFVGKEALAAVGSVGPVINSLVGFFMGLGTGAGVVISRYFGAGDREGLSRAVHTTIMLTVIAALFCTVMGIALVPNMLRLMSTPDDVFNESATYLRIYFFGIAGLMLYNIGSSILRAVGDSRRPLYFLCISALMNIVLDLLFVVAFRWGIAGVAWATLVSQAISAVLVMALLMRTDAAYRVSLKKLAIDGGILKRIIQIGLPSGIQSSIISFSNVFVHGYINAFGSTAMAGWTSYAKVEAFISLPMQSIALTSTTFVGQNLGAGDLERTKKGIRTSLFMSLGATVLLSFSAVLFSTPLLRLFSTDADVLEAGREIVFATCPFYFGSCFTQIYAGALRGAGRSTPPTIITLFFYVAFRQTYLFIVSRTVGTLAAVSFGFPLAWILAGITTAVYFFRCNWEKDALTRGPSARKA